MHYFFFFQGGAGELIDKGDTTYGGKWVINPSGGLISKGHPLGATGNSSCIRLLSMFMEKICAILFKEKAKLGLLICCNQPSIINHTDLLL